MIDSSTRPRPFAKPENPLLEALEAQERTRSRRGASSRSAPAKPVTEVAHAGSKGLVWEQTKPTVLPTAPAKAKPAAPTWLTGSCAVLGCVGAASPLLWPLSKTLALWGGAMSPALAFATFWLRVLPGRAGSMQTVAVWLSAVVYLLAQAVVVAATVAEGAQTALLVEAVISTVCALSMLGAAAWPGSRPQAGTPAISRKKPR